MALDRLGFDEAWFGEHHSGGYELIACPEVFIAAAAERTKHIRLGTGVVSLPYHHPLMVADRWVLLDHLTRGRVMFGTGPGALPSDAYMMGIDPVEQRRMMQESLEAILALFRAGPDERIEQALRLVHAARRPAAHPAVHLALPRDLHGGNDFPVRPAAGGRSSARRCFRCRCRCPAATRRWRTTWDVVVDQAEKSGRDEPDRRGLAGAGRSCTSPTPGTRRSTTAPTGCRISRTTSARPASSRWPTRSRAASRPASSSKTYAATGNCCIGTPGRCDRLHPGSARPLRRLRDLPDARPRLGVTRRRRTTPTSCSPARSCRTSRVS